MTVEAKASHQQMQKVKDDGDGNMPERRGWLPRQQTQIELKVYPNKNIS